MIPDGPFLQAILEGPDDHANRLVYADFLDKHGEPGWAELLRAQCELARTPLGDPRWQALLVNEEKLFVARARECVAVRLRELLTDGTPHDDPDLRRFAAHGILGLLGEHGGLFGVREDGQVVYALYESPEQSEVETDWRLRNLVVHCGSFDYPEFRVLIPPRPVWSQDCRWCSPRGPDGRPITLCYCGGIGWYPGSEPLPDLL
jgi:uncharacterized protein (TIGR02996 family)